MLDKAGTRLTCSKYLGIINNLSKRIYSQISQDISKASRKSLNIFQLN